MPKIIPRFKQETSKKIARFHYELNPKIIARKNSKIYARNKQNNSNN